LWRISTIIRLNIGLLILVDLSSQAFKVTSQDKINIKKKRKRNKRGGGGKRTTLFVNIFSTIIFHFFIFYFFGMFYYKKWPFRIIIKYKIAKRL